MADALIAKGIQEILNRQWLGRIWTVQEATMAKKLTLICGSVELNWTTYFDTLRCILFRVKSSTLSPEWHSYRSSGTQWSSLLNTIDWSLFLNSLEMQLRNSVDGTTVIVEKNLLDIAFDFRHTQATDPRDKFYAVLGLRDRKAGGEVFIKPDHTLSLEEVHRDFTSEIERIHGIIEETHTGAT